MKQVNKNFIYNIIYQIFIYIIPLVSVPYVSRTLGVNNIGIYSYTYSIVYYFMLAAMLGINNYGARTIAKCKDNIKERSYAFWSIHVLQAILSLIMLILYISGVLIFGDNYKTILLIQSIYLVSVFFDINWFFFGIEKFKITISRNIIIKLISLILIFYKEHTMENTFKGSKNYVASPELMNAVNIAMALKKPLLIKGEPGTGKTMLAEAVAEALGKKLIIWSVKSTTKAQDGLYVYDVVQRLYDSQFGASGVDDIAKYIKLGKLGEAFSADEQVVLLIDEVDKADLEFPNDLLWELDKMEFYIPETKETIKAKHRPIVIITSNAEKELPDAFLRRCIFHYIEFPDQQQMEKIIRVHFDHVDETLLMQAMQAFYYIRSIDSVEKKPSTSELVDWIRALELTGVDTSRITKEIPFIGVLLKKDKDISTVQRRLRR